MKYALLGAALLLSFAIDASHPGHALEPGPALSKVIEGAKKEGKLKLMWGEGTLGGTKGAAKFQTMMNEMFGTDIEIGFSPGPSMPRMGTQIATEYAAGQTAATDVYIGAPSYLAPLVERKVFHHVDWPSLMPGRIIPDMVEAGGTNLKVYSGLPGVPYNTRRLPTATVPTSLKDFLKPEWKGKIASTPYAVSLNILAAKEMWGKEAALEYVRALSKQVAGLIRCNEIERLVSGEFLALVMDCSGSQTFELNAKGAPVDLIVPTDGAMLRHRLLAIPRNAEHPNAAKLFTTFMLTKEAQKVLWEMDYADLFYFPESKIGEKVRKLEKQGVKFFIPTVDWVASHPEIEEVRGEMVKILQRK